MNIDSLKIDDLYNLTESELVDLMFSSLFDIKPIEVVNNNLIEKGVKLYEADFNIVKKHIKYENSDNVCVFRVPVLDQREDPALQIKMFTNPRYENDGLPINNYFVYVFTKVIRHPFSIVEVQYIGQHFTRNDSDFQFDRFQHKFNKSEFLYYNFEEQKYLQANPEEIRKAKRDLENGESLESLSVDKEVKVYLHRENLLKVGRSRLWEAGNEFLNKLSEVKSKRASEGNSIQKHLNYLKMYGDFLNELDKGLKIHLLFANITVREYEKLVKKKEELQILIDNLILKLEQLAGLMISSGRYFKYTVNKDALLTENLNETIIKDTEEFKLYAKIKQPGFTTLKEFLTAHTSGLISSGYIGYDLERWELYPNIAQIEKRRNFTSESMNAAKQKEYEDKLLNAYAKKGK